MNCKCDKCGKFKSIEFCECKPDLVEEKIRYILDHQPMNERESVRQLQELVTIARQWAADKEEVVKNIHRRLHPDHIDCRPGSCKYWDEIRTTVYFVLQYAFHKL